MTNLEAIRNYIEPYEVSDGKLELLLSEQGLQSSSNYVPLTMKTNMYLAVIEVLTALLPLVREKDNGSEVQYDADALESLINHYRREIGEESDLKPQNRDMTEYW